MRAQSGNSAAAQGLILLTYMHDRIREQMAARKIEVAKSLILLKHWNKARTQFEFLYWEEDFIGFVDDLINRHHAGELEWVVQEAGLHARDKKRLVQKHGRADGEPEPIRLLRMHYKHNQIFTDHDIPADANRITFSAELLSWERVAELIAAHQSSGMR